MGEKNKKKISKKKNVDTALPSYSWMGEDGLPAILGEKKQLIFLSLQGD